MDAITRKNAVLVQEAANATRDQEEQADGLEAAVAQFKLDKTDHNHEENLRSDNLHINEEHGWADRQLSSIPFNDASTAYAR
jgi:hypothetical protein